MTLGDPRNVPGRHRDGKNDPKKRAETVTLEAARNVAVENRDGGICPNKRPEDIVTVEAVRRKLPGRVTGESCPKRGERTT